MPTADPQLAHLLRRAGFGTADAELDYYANQGIRATIDELVYFEGAPDNQVDSLIGKPGYATVVSRQFSPNGNITDARQRWLFRMLYTSRPLQEKIALFWHNHFAVGYTKLAGALNAEDATRLMDAMPSQDRTGIRGQIQMFREIGMGKFRDLLIAIAKDNAELVFLDGRNNFKARPQENFAREVMELHSIGVGNYTEADVKTAARVFTGWNQLRTNVGTREVPYYGYKFQYNPAQHDTASKTFTFPIYPDGAKTIPARSATEGIQDGLDLLNGLVAFPTTAERIVSQLYTFFVNELDPSPNSFRDALVQVFRRTDGDIRAVLLAMFSAPEFYDGANMFARYSWPVEFVVRVMKDLGGDGVRLSDAVVAMNNMQQPLYDPPNVGGFHTGREWFSTGAMLARMNWAATVARARGQAMAQSIQAASFRNRPELVLDYCLDQLGPIYPDDQTRQILANYLRAGSGASWTGSSAQLLEKVPGLAHVIIGSADYQLI